QRAAKLFRSAIDASDDALRPIVAEAIAHLGDDEPALRKAALEVLGHAAAFRHHHLEPDVIRRVVLRARDDAWGVRAEAACALALIPDVPEPDRSEALARLLDDEEAKVREEAAAALGDVGARAALE